MEKGRIVPFSSWNIFLFLVGIFSFYNRSFLLIFILVGTFPFSIFSVVMDHRRSVLVLSEMGVFDEGSFKNYVD